MSSFEMKNASVAPTTDASVEHSSLGGLTMNTIANINVPVIAGVEITTDSEGRFNLNALHKASGSIHTKRPSIWLATKQAQELITELSQNSGLAQNLIEVTKGGLSPGTFAHELLAISYAGWISPSFQLQVNQIFLDYRTGKLKKPDINAITRKDLAYMLIESEEENERLKLENAQLKPDVDAFQRIAKADGSLCLTDAAKNLQIRRKDLLQLLSSKKWIYRRAGNKNWLGYQDKIQQGVVEHKVSTKSLEDGTERIYEQVRVTTKGLTKISQILHT